MQRIIRFSRNMVFIGICLFAGTTMAQKTTKIKPTKFISTAIPEPSDICYNPNSDTFFVVSDDGILFETDQEGKIIRSAVENDADFEAVYTDGTNVYAVNERHRKVEVFNSISLKKSKTITVPFGGGRNRGYEALTYNKSKNSFILIVEKDPITLFELDANFAITNQIDLSKMARDFAAASYYENFLWLLSDEDRTVFKLNPNTYEVVGKWELPLINPEGLAFDKNGNLLITCDDMQRIYYFNNPEK